MITSKRLTRTHARAYLALGLGWLCSLTACAHHAPQEHVHARHEPAPGTIQVTGVGEAHGAPDVARSSIGVEARAPSVQEALQRANAQIAQIIQALKAQGIAEADLQTQGFSVNYDREYQPPAPLGAVPQASATTATSAAAPAPRGKKATATEVAPVSEIAAPAPAPARGSYVVNNQLQVTVREVSKLGDVLSAATAAGANNIWGISFDLSDKQPLVDKARALAIESAKRDAERVATLSGVKLGKLLRVTDGEMGAGAPVATMRAYSAANAAVPVERGELTIDHRVSVEYAIGE
ncbi:MAG TPA: SIMPL domain-containing protein [Polyangiaceae bacterium]|nr:SIMPL domain-containing protein [Polyangiaceae bacterium]